jgi:hypothetical protein
MESPLWGLHGKTIEKNGGLSIASFDDMHLMREILTSRKHEIWYDWCDMVYDWCDNPSQPTCSYLAGALVSLVSLGPIYPPVIGQRSTVSRMAHKNKMI